MILTRSRC